MNDTKGFSRRYSTTQLRISAHGLEIERGRYAEIPRESRFCNWCKTSMRVEVIESENHVLFECDLYADLRAKLISQLNKSPEEYNKEFKSLSPPPPPQSLNINKQSLKVNFMKILSPYTTKNFDPTPIDQFSNHHTSATNKNNKISQTEKNILALRRSYLINCVCTFILHTLNKHLK